MEIEEVVRSRTIRRCVQRADVRYEATGEVEIVTVKDADGVEKTVEKAIKQQVSIPAKYVEEEIEETVYCVNDGVDTHEFSDKKAAKDFAKGK